MLKSLRTLWLFSVIEFFLIIVIMLQPKVTEVTVVQPHVQPVVATVQLQMPEVETTEPMVPKSLGEYTVTAYCSCEKCCGSRAAKRPNGVVYGAAGQPLVAGISVAALQENLPFGSVVYIEGIGIRIVQDTGPEAIFDRYDGKLIDVYCDSHEDAIKIAKSTKEVWLLESPGDMF